MRSSTTATELKKCRDSRKVNSASKMSWSSWEDCLLLASCLFNSLSTETSGKYILFKCQGLQTGCKVFHSLPKPPHPSLSRQACYASWYLKQTTRRLISSTMMGKLRLQKRTFLNPAYLELSAQNSCQHSCGLIHFMIFHTLFT